jgi:hypothetical protein
MFSKKPVLSKSAHQSPKKLSQLKLVTNQFRLTFHNKYMIHIYSLNVYPDTRESKECLKEIVGKLDKELKLTFLNYLHSGNNLFSPSYLDEEIEFPCQLGSN